MAEVFNPQADIPSFEEQNAQLLRQQKLADFLRKQAVASKAPEGQMVGKQYIRPHFLQELAPIIAGMSADAAEQQAANSQSAGLASMLRGAQQWEGQMPQATPAVPQKTAPFMAPGMDGEENIPGTSTITQQAIPEVPVTRNQALKYTMQGLRNPLTKDAALLYHKGFNEDLTREDTQAARRETLQATLAAKREEQKALLEQRAADAQLRSEDMRLSIEQRREAAAESAQARRDVAAIMAAASQANAALRSEKPKELKPMPATMAGAYNGNEASIKQIDDAIAAVESNRKAFGLARIGPNLLNEAVDPKGIEARAKVSRVGSVKRHDISGAAVTVSEDKKLAPWLPEAHQSPDSIITKLKNIKADLKHQQDSIELTAESQGYKPMRSGAVVPPPAAGGAPPSVSWGDLK